MIDEATWKKGLELTLERTDLESLGDRFRNVQRGKVRDSYRPGDGIRVLITTDRISAFDRVLCTLPFKGQVLNQLSTWWFEQTAAIAPNHLIRQVDPAAVIATECEALPVEFVVRAYLTGVTPTSVWSHYSRGEREFCGHRLPDHLKKNEALPEAILTPSTKAEKGGRDESVSRATLIARGVLDEKTFDRAADIAHALFEYGQRTCAERGLILVDTKYEIGRTADGDLMVIDEIHTPDSSRYWRADSYETRMGAGEEPDSLDKEYVRRWLHAQGFDGAGKVPPIPDDVRTEAARRYVEACEMIWGRPFEPDLEDPQLRITRNLKEAL